MNFISSNGKKVFFSIKLVILVTIFVFLFNNFTVVNTVAQSSFEIINHENLLEVHNKERSKQGLSPLKINFLLNISAQRKADLMLQNNCWSHYCPPNKSPWEFFGDAGYKYVFAGENLAEGFYKISDVFNAWMNSKSHRENILKPQFEEVGFGIAYGNFQSKQNNILIVVHFGKRDIEINPQISIEITNPKENQVFEDRKSIEGQGIYTPKDFSFEKIEIYNNEKLQDTGTILDGIFTFNTDLEDGKNKIIARGYLNNLPIAESKPVTIQFNPSNIFTFTNSDSTSVNFNLIEVDKDVKNLINLIFILILLFFGLLDLYLLNRTNTINNRSFTSYHIGVLIILAFTILIGGIGGKIM